MLELEKIKSLLDSPDEELRIKGLFYLDSEGDDSSLSLIAASLGDKSWRVRKTAVETILRIDDIDRVLPYLLEGLRSEENAGLRNAAAESLETVGRRALDYLIGFIDDDDHDLRKSVIDIIGNIGDERATPHLIKALSDPDENVKSAAAENLGKIGDDDAVNSLIETLKSDDLLLKFSSLEALCRIGRGVTVDQIIPHLNNPLLKKAAFEVLGNTADVEAIPYLLKGLEDRSKSTKAAALKSLVNLVSSLENREDAISDIISKRGALPEFIMPCLETDDEDVAMAALRFLGWIRSRESIRAMLKWALNETTDSVVLDAVKGMGLEAEKELVKAYHESDDELKPFVCRLLGEIASVSSVPLLIEALKSRVGHIRHSSAVALGIIGSGDAIPHLARLLEDEYEDVREAVIQAFSRLSVNNGATILRMIREGLASESVEMRRNSIKLLANIDIERDPALAVMALRDEDGYVRKCAADALGEIGGTDAANHLLLSLSDEERDVRIAAIESLCRVKHRDAYKSLLSVLNDEDIWVKSAAVKAIAELGGEDSAPHLAGMLGAEVGLVTIAALEALGGLALAEYAPAMMEASKSEDHEVVKSAIESLLFWNDSSYIARLTALLNHPNWEVRISAARVLAEKLGDGAVSLLRERLDLEDDELVRSTIEEALSKYVA